MFTGIIEEIGKIKSSSRGARSVRLDIECKKVLDGTQIGDSISVNGVCLTVTTITSSGFTADVMHETMTRSNLGALKVGDRVNLERALTLSSRLGGHIVSGHIDGVGSVVDKREDDIAIWITISTSSDILRYIIEKGSITIDGISLTVAEVDSRTFKVSIIPHTQDMTTLTSKRVGEVVNIENDMIAKYVEKLLGKETKGSGLSFEFLKENGF